METDSFTRSKIMKGSQNFKFRARDADYANLGGQYWDCTQEGTVLQMCAKFQADSVIC